MKYLFFVFILLSCSEKKQEVVLASAGAPSQSEVPSKNLNNEAPKIRTKNDNQKKEVSKAPDFFGLEWYNSKHERIKNIRLADIKGKLTFIDVFIKTCPGCPKSHKIFKKIYNKYKNRKDVQFFGIQSVSYGHERNNLEGLKEIRKEYGFDFPMAQDDQAVVIAQYGAGGTPWNIVIGPEGTIEHNYFFISEEDADKYVSTLLK